MLCIIQLQLLVLMKLRSAELKNSRGVGIGKDQEFQKKEDTRQERQLRTDLSQVTTRKGKIVVKSPTSGGIRKYRKRLVPRQTDSKVYI